MVRFLIRRTAIAILVAITVSIIGFSLLRLSGDIASVLAGEAAKPADVARIAHAYGLDRPLYIQYLDWAWHALQGDLGQSLFTHEPVAGLILDRIGVTAILAVSSLIFALVIAVPLGIAAALRANT